MSVKITALEAENVKRIKAVALTPSPTGLTIVGGNNNQGKTSVLDALAWALGGDRFRPDAAQRDGAVAPAHLKVKLSNGVVVERKGKNASLTVTDPTGRRSGQQLLNAFVEPLALDLPRFMDASDKEKADILLRIIGIGTELHTRDMEIKALYDKRTFTGQLAAQKKHFAEELISYPEAPDEPVSASDLIRQQQDILAHNGENQRKRSQLAQLTDLLERQKKVVADLEFQLSTERQRLDTMQADVKIAQTAAADLQDESTAELEASIRRAIRQIETERKLEALAPVQPEPETPTAPEAPAPAHPESENQQTALVMAHVRRYLEDNYMFDISLDSVGEILHISPAYLSAQFKKYQKMNFLDCLTELRINAAKELLNDPFRSSAEVASMVGYEDASYFARAFKKRTGVTPTQYRKQAAKAAKDQQEAAL